MKIIQATINEIPEVAPLFNEYMQFYRQKSDLERYTRFLKNRLTNNEATIFLALSDTNQPAGFVLNYHTFSSVSLGKVITLND